MPTAALREAAAVVSPRHRAWRRLLKSLTLDPDRLPRPLPAPTSRDFIMCGSPRSGTALLVAMLFQPPRVVTVMEPWDGLRLPPDELFASLRHEVTSTGTLGRGRLDIDALQSVGAVRWLRDGEQSHALTVDPDFQLGVKFPAFWRYLEYLPETRFLVCLRDPVEVVRSYEQTGGRLEQGLDYDVPFNSRLNQHLLEATDSPAVRRVLLYDYIHRQMLPHLHRPNVLVVRYERWFTQPDEQLADISAFLGVDVSRAPARLQAPRSRGETEPALRRLLRAHCTVADELGYAL